MILINLFNPMQLILKEKNEYIIRFDKGEELLAKIKKFCQQQKIKAATFTGLGACQQLVLSHYDVDKKKYSDLKIRQKMEIDNLSGLIAIMKKDTLIHLHGIFSDKGMNVRGGHVKSLVVAATCEVMLSKLNKKLEREYSKKIGLNLLK